MKKAALLFIFIILTAYCSLAQKTFTHQDTLRGAITPERIWWDVTYYHLSVNVNIEKRIITGNNRIQYKVLESNQTLQIELQEPLKISKIIQNEKELNIKKDGYSYFIELLDKQEKGAINELTVYYEGKPKKVKIRLGVEA